MYKFVACLNLEAPRNFTIAGLHNLLYFMSTIFTVPLIFSYIITLCLWNTIMPPAYTLNHYKFGHFVINQYASAIMIINIITTLTPPN